MFECIFHEWDQQHGLDKIILRESVKYISSEKEAVERIESYMDRLILHDVAVTTET